MQPSPRSLFSQIRSQPIRFGLIGLLVLVASCAFIWEVERAPRHLPPSWSEDARDLRLAQSIAAGDWLGDFDARTLEVRPGYALFLARCADLGLSERRALSCLQITASVLFMLLLLGLGVAPELALLSFGLALFSPALFGQLLPRLAVEKFSALLALILVAGSLHFAVARHRFQALLIAILMGLFLALQVLTSPQWSWLLVFIAAAVFLAGYRDHRLGHGPRLIALRSCVFIFVLVFPAWIGTTLVQNLNAERYGMARLSDADEPEFNRALGALERVATAQPSGRLERPTRAQLYQVSPAFQRLSGAFESPLFSGPIDGHDDHGRRSALRRKTAREGAARLGLYNHPTTAQTFWAELADEINQAVDSGLVDGSEETFTTDRPGLQAPSLGLTWRRLRELWNLEFEDLLPGDPLPHIEAQEPEVRTAETILGPFPWREDFLQSAAKRRSLLDLYRRVLPTLFILAGIGSLMTLLAQRRSSWRSRHYAEIVLLAGSMTVLMMLCHEEATWIIDRGRGFLLLHLIAPFYLALGFQHHLGVAAEKLKPLTKERCQNFGLGFVAILLLGTIFIPQYLTTRTATSAMVQLAPEFITTLESAAQKDDLSPPLLQHDGAYLRLRLRQDPVRPSPQVLVLEWQSSNADYGSPVEISWTGSSTDERGNKKRQLFARPGPQVSRLALSPGQLGDLEIRATEDADLQIEVTALSLAALGRPFVVANDPLPELSFTKSGEVLNITIRGGEALSRYELYFSTARSESARVYPERQGELWLSAAAGLHELDGSDYRMIVLTDHEGNGQASRRYEAKEEFSPKIMTQALGRQHFSAAPVTVEIVD